MKNEIKVLCIPMAVGVLGACSTVTEDRVDKPNLIIIYADDVGYGDLSVYGSTMIKTPEIDQLAAGGARFTNAYCMASTSTPSRYSLLTGKYAFRNPDAQILSPDANMILEPGSGTLGEVMQSAGYRTAVIGKWHLGVGEGDTDWNKEIKPTPLETGFHESFIIPSTNDRVPTVWVKGNRVYNWSEDDDPLRISHRERIGNLPTGTSHPEKLIYPADGYHSGTIVNGISRIGFMDGGQSAWWSDENMGLEILERSLAFIEGQKDEPFFLFMPMHQTHVPRVPHEMFLGKSDTGLRGDHIVELDYIVGQVVQTLEELQIRGNTLIIFSSDNGPVIYDSYYDGAIEDGVGHVPNGPFRGGKYHVYEGGTRMPTIVNWPDRVEAGIVSDAMLSQVDLLASIASLIGEPVPEGAAPDSQNQLSAWLGETGLGREYVIQQGVGMFAIRKGDWKLILAGETPAWVDRRHNDYPNAISTPMPSADAHSLFNLADDPGESNDLADEYPEKVEKLLSLFHEIKGQHTE